MFYSAQHPDRHRKSSRYGPFDAEQKKTYENRFLTPKKYGVQPRPFHPHRDELFSLS